MLLRLKQPQRNRKIRDCTGLSIQSALQSITISHLRDEMLVSVLGLYGRRHLNLELQVLRRKKQIRLTAREFVHPISCRPLLLKELEQLKPRAWVRDGPIQKVEK